jgi:competence/damage-inducible protein CinA-like protein
MRAIFIAVGSEMLERNTIDTNSLYVQKQLMEKGILMDMKIVVRDDIDQLSWLVKTAFKRAQLLIICGGLGPTEDDLTREAVASALKRDLIFKEEMVVQLKERFKKRGIRQMPQNNTRQAFIIEGSQILHNTVGTAPGLYIDDPECQVVLLPGPPEEMKAMFDTVLVDKIAPLSHFHIYKRSFIFGGVSESGVDEKIADIYRKYRNPKTTILANPGVIEVHLLGRSRKTIEEAQTLTDELAEKIKERMKDHLLTEQDITIEEYVLSELKARNLTLSTAESCTGGGLGDRITNIPGSSAVYLGGVIAYSNDLKMKLLGVNEETLIKHGAVSKEVVKEMAHGIREITGSDIALATSGIAGPGGAVDGKPVGMVFMHLAAKDLDIAMYKLFPGPRQGVKQRSVNYSLNLIKEYLKKTNTVLPDHAPTREAE